MNTNKRLSKERWMISVPAFSKEKRAALEDIAKKNRQSLSAYIGNLLEEEIRKASKEDMA